MTSPILVVAAVIREGRRVFLAQRADNLLWEFPGGKVRAGEDARAALRREIQEELGLEIEVGEPLEVATVLHPRHLTLIFFAARIVAGEPQRLDCADFRWVGGGGDGQSAARRRRQDHERKTSSGVLSV